jgi:hypothetical protein
VDNKKAVVVTDGLCVQAFPSSKSNVNFTANLVPVRIVAFPMTFLTHPEVAMDNNAAERANRNPVIGRKNYYGSGSVWSSALAVMMFSLLQTIELWKLNPHNWLQEYLTACANNGGKAPPDLTTFLPWRMSEDRRMQLDKPPTGDQNTS